MPANSKKKKRRNRARGPDDDEDSREEIAVKIEEQKIKKAKSKSLFTRRKNQLEDLLEDEVASREIRASRKKLDEAQENVIEDLTSLIALYSEAGDRSCVEKTRRELEGIEEEFSRVQESVQEYLDANKDELSSQASGFSGKLCNLHSRETKACQRVTELREQIREKEQSVKHAREKMEEECARLQKEMEAEIREAKDELVCAKGDCKEKYSKLEGAIDEVLKLSPPCSPKDPAVKPKEEKKTGEELGKDMWKQLTRVSIPGQAVAWELEGSIYGVC